MSCEEALELLSGHLDGENTPEQEAALSAHLAACESCRSLLEAYEEIDKNVAAMQEPAPEGLAKGVMYRIHVATGKQKRSRKWFIGPGTALGAIAAVLLLLIGTGKIRLPESGSSEGMQAAGVAQTAVTEAAAEAELTQKGETFAVSEDMEAYGIDRNAATEGDEALFGSSMLQALPTLEFMLDDGQYTFCTSLSTENTAAVLAYQGVDASFFTLLSEAEPAFAGVFDELTAVEQTDSTRLVYRTSFSLVMALQEWFDEQLPKDEEELQGYGWDRFAQEDPENSYLTTYIQKRQTPVQLSGQWPENWAQEWRLEQNWALFYPDTSYQPQKDDTAYIVLLPAE